MPATGSAPSKGFGELFGEAKGALDELQAGLASILPAMPGMPAGKYFDLAIGIDFEQTIMPPCPVFPVPHVGMVFDIFGAIMNAIANALPPVPEVPEGEDAPVTVLSVATAIVNALKPSVKVHGRWINNAGTPVMHLPAMFLHLLPLAVPTSSSEMWMGSSTVLADGGPFSTQFHPNISCNLVGFPSLPRMNKTPRPVLDLMLPTSLLLAILSSGSPVLVGGPPTIDLFQLFLKMGLKGLLKKVKIKKLDDLGSKFQKKIDNVGKTHPKLASALQPIKCKNFGEPVDAATGRVIHNNVDFELPGPIPLVWERTYYSDAAVETPLGYNWHHSYNIGLRDLGNGFTLRLGDGRETAMPYLVKGEVFYHRIEKLFFERDAKGYFVTDQNQQVWRFADEKDREGFALLADITDPQWFAIRFSYDYQGHLRQILDSAGRRIAVETDDAGRVLEVYTNADKKRVSFIEYQYDALGNMTATRDRSGAEKSFIYEDHLLTKLTNQSGHSFYWEYEGRGDDARCIHTWGDGGVLEYWTEYLQEPDGSGVTITRNSLGHTTEYHYDHRKLIFKLVDANGGITRQFYNDYQDLELVVNPEGGSIQYRYNSYGNLIRLVNENEESSGFQYNDKQQIIFASSPGGKSISQEYDEQGRLVSRTGIAGNTIRYEYQGPVLSRITDARDRSLELLYNERHELILLRFPNGLEEVWEYDELGEIQFHKDVRGNISRYYYDEAGNLSSLEEPDGNRHRFEYDASGNLTEARDFSHQVRFEYGPLGTLRSRKQHNRSIHFNYDTELQLRSIVNEGGEIYKFGLDAVGNVVSEWGFDGLNKRYQRDGNGRVKKVLRPGSQWTSYEYDSVGNIVKESHSDGTMAAYKYNPDAELIEAINENSHIRLLRDQAGQVVKELQDGYEVYNQFDEDGNCIHIGSSLGASIDMQYDQWGGLTGMSALQGVDGTEQGLSPLDLKIRELEKRLASNTPGGGDITLDMNGRQTNAAGPETTKGSWTAFFQLDETGLELQRQLSGGVDVRTERDQLGRVTRRSIGTGNIEQRRTRYEWGRGNKLHRMVNELRSTHTSFDYDPFDNLISATYAEKGSEVTVYKMPDKVGNLYKTKNRKDRKYSKGGRLQEDEHYAYHYDAEGNIVFKEFRRNENPAAVVHTEYARTHALDFKRTGTGWIYEWSVNGMLRKVINPGGRQVLFYYDPLGRRTAKIVLQSAVSERSGLPQHALSSDQVTRWIWDGNVPLHEWNYTGDYPPRKSVDGAGLQEEPEPVTNLLTWVFEPESFVPCARLEADQSHSIITDYLGTPTQAFSQSGELVWERELDIYGSAIKLQKKNGFIPYLYQGQYVDEETGLAYNRFRYYDAEIGNYISQDPIGLNGGMALYGYVHDTNFFIDVFGLSGQRWMGKTKKDGTPYSKPGPKPKGEGAHNAKIEEIIKRETSPGSGVTHIGGGSKTEIIIDTAGGHKPYRRMDASFRNPDGSIYHINVGRTLEDGKTGIMRERLAIDDVTKKGHNVSFEGYGKDSDYRAKRTRNH